MSESFVSVRGLRIRYWNNGIKNPGRPVIVLFHGSSFSLDNWKQTKTLDVLTKQNYSVYAVDLPAGKGTKSDRVDGKKFRSLEDLVPLIDEIFEKIGIKQETLTVIGPSLGGGFAVAYALAHPERVGALALIAPALSNLAAEEDVVSQLDMPVLLVWGDKDNLFPVDEFGRSLKQKLGHSKLLILRGAGHAAYLDKPDEFNDLLLDFLSEV